MERTDRHGSEENPLKETKKSSAEIKANLAIVMARVEGDGSTNSNLLDTPHKRAEHGYWFDNRVRT